MPFFRVVLEGDGIVIPRDSDAVSELGWMASDLENRNPIIGFFTTRFVRATDENAAAKKASLLVDKEWAGLPLKESNSGTRPRLSVNTVKEIGLVAYLSGRPRKGFTFYTDGDDKSVH